MVRVEGVRGGDGRTEFEDSVPVEEEIGHFDVATEKGGLMI